MDLGFTVRILKPNEAFAPIRVPIAELSSATFSDGQRSTVATALMLMLSELRRQSRSAAGERNGLIHGKLSGDE